MQIKHISNATELAKDIIRKVVQSGDCVVDATIGNGNDTIFLCQLVGENGKVYGFDIQKEAIEATEIKLIKQGYINRTILIQSGHENMNRFIEEQQISAIMFNLGYMPRFNHNITTKHDTTIRAIEESIKVLKKNGIITIAVYPGHDEGMKEKIELLNYLSKVDQKFLDVLKMEFINQINNPPLLIVVQKKY